MVAVPAVVATDPVTGEPVAARPPRQSLGDYLVDEGEASNLEIQQIQRYGSRNRYGTGGQQPINFGQDISQLSAAELTELILDVADASERASLTAEAEAADALLKQTESNEAQVQRAILAALEGMANPCPPVIIEPNVPEFAQLIVAVADPDVPDPTNPLTGAPGGVVLP